MADHALFRPKRPAWFVAAACTSALALAVFLAATLWRGWSPGDAWGRTFGIAAAALLAVEVLYAVRRRIRVAPVQTAQNWLQLHVYGGAIGFVFILVHEGFRLPSGTFGWLLLLFTLLTTAFGIAGVFLQKLLPRVMTALPVEAIYERIPATITRLRGEARDVVAPGSDRLKTFYETEVDRTLVPRGTRWTYVFDVTQGRDGIVTTFERIKPYFDEADQSRAAALLAIALQKRDLDAHYAVQAALRAWLLVHVPVAFLLTALVVAHIITVLRF